MSEKIYKEIYKEIYKDPYAKAEVVPDTEITVANSVTLSSTMTSAKAGQPAVASDFTISAPTGATIVIDSGQTYATAGSSKDITFTATAEDGYKITDATSISIAVFIPKISVSVPTTAVVLKAELTNAKAGKPADVADFTITNPSGVTISLDSGQTYAAAGSSSGIKFTAQADATHEITSGEHITVTVAISA